MIISNSSPLILLAKVNRLELLKKLYRKVHIPEEVYHEVVIRGKEERYSDAFIIEREINDSIEVMKVGREYSKEAEGLHRIIGSGESGAIALAIQERCGLLLIDNLEPRKIAEAKDIRCRSTPGIALEALAKKVIDHDEYENLIKGLSGFAWLSGDIVAHFLEQGYKLKYGK